MSLLSIIASTSNTVNNLNTSITYQGNDSSGANTISVTGANSGQIYVALHYTYNTSGISTAPGTASGFTSLTSYAQSGSIMSYRMSYRILTSNTTTFTFPAVSGATNHGVAACVYTPLSGTASSLSLIQNNSSYGPANTTSGDVDARPGDIAIGLGLFYPGGAGSGNSFPTPSLGLGFAIGVPGISAYLTSKVSTAPQNLPWSFTIGDATTTFSNTALLRPTFS